MRRLLASLVLLLAFAPGARAEDAILVFDASGSMWGQIDGKSKIEIAREVIGGLLSEIPADRPLGLVAYGHRRAGDCADIEEIVPVGTDRAAIRAAVNAFNPKGKTPLSDGVRFAAGKLRYTDVKATVILVTDGAESCNTDPCALGAELEAAGVDFTAHVIGFGLESATEAAGLRCLAEATGGRYLAAKNASELSSALEETVAAAEAAPIAATAARITLRATELEGGPEVTSGLAWRVAPAGGEPVFTVENAGVVETEIVPGDYAVSVERAADGLKGKATLSARAGAERTVTVPLEISLAAALTATPASEAPAGSKLSVAWQGPNRAGDYVTVVAKGDVPTAYGDHRYTKDGNPLDIRLPADAGDYELRYLLGQPQRVLASVPVRATPVTASLTAPDSAAAGATVEVAWTGPGYDGDWVTVVKPDAAAAAYLDYFTTTEGSTGQLTLPTEPGGYELRYVTKPNHVLGRRPITVTGAEASLVLPAEAPAGSILPVSFTGPRNRGDWVTIVRQNAAATAYGSYFDADRAAPFELEVPIEVGDYEARYVLQGRTVIARAPVRATPVSAGITAPTGVAAGATFEISWTGPNYRGDWLTIVKPSDGDTAYASYVDAIHGSPAKLSAPVAAGSYEVRYVLKGKKVIARQAISVTAP